VKVIGYSTHKPHTTAIVDAMLESVPNSRLMDVSKFDECEPLPDADYIVISGILRGCGMVYKACVEQKRDFLFIDHAYFDAGYEEPTWMRVTKNRHVFGPGLEGCDELRYGRLFNRYRLQPWRGWLPGGYILVLPPTDAIGWLFDQRDWQHDTIREIKRRTDLPIKVRPKPTNAIVDDRGNLLKMKNVVNGTTLAEDVAGAAAVVVYNSNAALEVIEMGVPVICSENCSAYPISFKLDDLAMPDVFAQESRRQQLFWDLAYNQYNLYEMKKGVVYSRLGLR